jgi:hypothetical protein
MDFSNLTPQKIYFIQEKLNHRPRKKLDYRTPYEVFYDFFALNPCIQHNLSLVSLKIPNECNSGVGFLGNMRSNPV